MLNLNNFVSCFNDFVMDGCLIEVVMICLFVFIFDKVVFFKVKLLVFVVFDVNIIL